MIDYVFSFYLYVNTCLETRLGCPIVIHFCFVLERVQKHKSVIMKEAITYGIVGIT